MTDNQFQFNPKDFDDVLVYVPERFDKHLNLLNEAKSNSKYEFTLKLLFRQLEKIEYLSKSVDIISVAPDGYYPIHILVRSIIEHALVGYYAYYKAYSSKSDQCGRDYYADYMISEFFKRENYELGVDGIKNNISKHNTFANLKSKHPQFNSLTEAQLVEIHTVAKQFDVRIIVNYLVNGSDTTPTSLGLHRLLIPTLTLYNKFSSYVHGGPCAEMETFDNMPAINKSERLHENYDFAMTWPKVLKLYIIALLAEEDYRCLALLVPPAVSYKKGATN